MNALIVDDETLSREYIADLLAECCPEMHISGRASNVQDAARMIEAGSIDVVFLDIRMQQQSGFELLEQFKDREFEVVFTTAYNDQALRAIKHEAVDYLLKPIDKEEFRKAVDKLRRRLQEKFSSMTRDMQSKELLSRKIAIHHQQGFKMLSLEEIQYIEAAGSYTIVKLQNNEKIIVSSTLKKFEEKLACFWFYRIHKSYIINLYYFSEYLSAEGGAVIMRNGDSISVSRYKTTGLFRLIAMLTQGLKV